MRCRRGSWQGWHVNTAERCLVCSPPLMHGTARCPTAQRCGFWQVTAKREKRDAAREEARAEVRAGRGGASARAKASAVFADDAALAPVLDNSLGWGAFMATSANVRYQLINAFEERFLVRARPRLWPGHPAGFMRNARRPWEKEHGRADCCRPLQSLLDVQSSMLWPFITPERCRPTACNTRACLETRVLRAGAGAAWARSKAGGHVRAALQQHICGLRNVGRMRPDGRPAVTLRAWPRLSV